MKAAVVKSLDNDELSHYLASQLNHFFPEKKTVSAGELKSYIDGAEPRIFRCFSGVHKKYFHENGITHFDHLHSDQYCMYLYMLSNYIWSVKGDLRLAAKLYYLNKVMHGVDIYYTAELPEVFLFVHPVGSIIGRAKFSGIFVCYQGVTVGCLNEGIFPEFHGAVILYANSSVLGKCVIGENVCIAANASVVNETVPDNTVVVSPAGENMLRTNNKSVFQRPPFVYGV